MDRDGGQPELTVQGGRAVGMPLQLLARARVLGVPHGWHWMAPPDGWQALDRRWRNMPLLAPIHLPCPPTRQPNCPARQPPTHLTMASSSSAVQGPLCTSGFSTFCQRCRHCTSVRSIKCSAAQRGEKWRSRARQVGGQQSRPARVRRQRSSSAYAAATAVCVANVCSYFVRQHPSRQPPMSSRSLA
jgi:hypothetical protein